ncbi:hypothetical protein D5F01_LYC02185 [Larimichthys crocea]|uniref:Core-binding (CB) domain-containing protein n=1 Tax=Larimichthys crocea TaxID=215358 RepID=A0A6G0J7P7_LARCR|nr:hypothetical protein D5F01_LYC02185 [Larimichthys crocea]
MLSRQKPPPGEWRLDPEVVQMVWERFGRADVDLFASVVLTHCPLWFFLSEPTSLLGQDALAHSWPDRLLVPWPLPLRQDLLSQFGDGGWGHLASSPGAPLVACLARGPDSLLDFCDQAVVQTIVSACTASTRLLYANRWKLFAGWCGSQDVDPEHCSLPVLLKDLQTLLDKGLSASTIKVYVAAISARHAFVDGRSVGSHALVARFLKGALRLRPPHAVQVPSWDLPVVLEALCSPPFEPLEHADLMWLSC